MIRKDAEILFSELADEVSDNEDFNLAILGSADVWKIVLAGPTPVPGDVICGLLAELTLEGYSTEVEALKGVLVLEIQ